MSVRSRLQLVGNFIGACRLSSESSSRAADSRRLYRLLPLLVVGLFMLTPDSVVAQDADTQRPLPLPTNDLPDFTQQLELLRKLQSVVRSKEQQKASETIVQPPADQPSETDSTSFPQASGDVGQLSQLQNALKNLAGRLPPDFVAPSLDAIPKEDLKKALENPAMRKTVQEMLRQFAKDGVIPSQTPSAQGDSTSTPILPTEPSESRGGQPEAEDASASRGQGPSRESGEAAATNISEGGKQQPRDSNVPSADHESDAPDGAGQPVPPASLKSLQDLMNRLASDASSRDGDRTNPNGSEPDKSAPDNRPAAGGKAQDPSSNSRRSGPMRRRDPGTNPARQDLPAPSPDRKDVDPSPNNVNGRDSVIPDNLRNDKQSLSESSSRQEPLSETGKSRGGDSPPGSRSETQRRAIEALQEIMKEIEQEDTGNALEPPDAGAVQREMVQQDNVAGSGDIDRTRGADPGTGNNHELSSDEPRLDDQQGASQNGSSSLTEMPSVQRFLQDELERMKAAPQNSDSSRKSTDRRSRKSGLDRSSDRSEQPASDSEADPVPFNGDKDSKAAVPSIVPGRNPLGAPSSPPRTRSSESLNQNDRNESAMPIDQSPGQTVETPSDGQPSSRRDAGARSSSPVPRMNAQSTEKIRSELEQRGVMETLKKTWEKSVQESRERRQQELQREQQTEAASKAAREQSPEIEDRLSGLDQQLNELAQSLGENPNSEKAVADMVERIARDMSEQQRSGAPRGSGATASDSTMMERLKSDFPGKSMLRSIRDTVSDVLSETGSATPAASRSSAPIGSEQVFGSSGSFDFTPILYLTGILAAIAILFYGLKAVRFRHTPENALAGFVQSIRPAELSTRADIVRAFHEMAARTARSAQLWWTHRQVQHVLKSVAPEKQEAVETLVETYEQARYLPQEVELSPDQIHSARSALQQLQT